VKSINLSQASISKRNRTTVMVFKIL